MTKTFQPGDRVRYSNPNYSYFGQEFTVCSSTRDSTLMTTGSRYITANLTLISERAVPTPDPISPTAFKADDGKDRFDLLMTKEGCASAIADVVKVLSFAVRPKEQGGKGYVPHSWRQVPEGRRRYLSAMYRHLAAIERGEEVDDESGLPHLAHVATNALFLAEIDKEAK